MSYQYQNASLTTSGTYIVIVPPTASTLQGKRVVRNFNVNFSIADSQHPFGFLLVYVPEGTEPSKVTTALGSNKATSIYEPNQNVIGQGVINPGGITNYKIPLARRLNSGDYVALVLYAIGQDQETDTGIYITVNYSIAF